MTALWIGLSAGFVAAQTSENPREINEQFMEKFRAGEYKEAIKLGEKLATLAPRSATVAYNNACAYAKADQKDKAFASLERAIQLKFQDIQLLKTDPDLDSLHGDPKFAAAVKKLEKTLSNDVNPSIEEAEYYFPTSFKEGSSGSVVLLHGWGEHPKRAIEKWKAAADKSGIAIIAPRGPMDDSQGSGNGYRWSTPDQTEKIINAAVKAAAEKKSINQDRLVLAGFSQGGQMAYIIGLNSGHQFDGIIPIAARWAPSEISPPDISADKMPKVYIMVGDGDNEFSGNQAAAAALKEWGVKYDLNVYPGVGHDYPENATEELTKAFDFIWGD